MQSWRTSRITGYHFTALNLQRSCCTCQDTRLLYQVPPRHSCNRSRHPWPSSDPEMRQKCWVAENHWTKNAQDKQNGNRASGHSNSQTPSGKSTWCQRQHVGTQWIQRGLNTAVPRFKPQTLRFPLIQLNTLTLWTCANTCHEPGS